MMSAVPFTAGDIVVVQADDGGAVGINNAGAPEFIDEYTPSGTLVEQFELPFNTTQSPLYNGSTDNSPAVGAAGSNDPNPVVISASAGPAGYISLSANGQYLAFTGYDASLPSSAALKSSSDNREVGLLDINGNLNDTTALNNFAQLNTPSAAFTLDGTSVIAGTSQLPGIVYSPVSASNANGVAGTTVYTNAGTSGYPSGGSFAYYNGQLYVDNGSSSGTNGSGTSGIYLLSPAAGDNNGEGDDGVPTMAGATLTALNLVGGPTSPSSGAPASPQLGNVVFATLDPTAHPGTNGDGLTQPDTLYVTNSTGAKLTSGGSADGGDVEKFVATSFNDTTGAPVTWTFAGLVLSSTTADLGATGLTGYSTGTDEVLFAQSGNLNQKSVSGSGSLFSYTDTSGVSLSSPVDSSGVTSYTLNPSSYLTGYTQLTGTSASAASMTVIATHGYDIGFRGISVVPSVAPTLTSSIATSLAAISENASSSSIPGELVSTLISHAGGITDTTSDNQGIYVTGTSTSPSVANAGTWQFSLNGGAAWQNFPASVSSSNALTLASDSSTMVRFVPAANFNGSASLTFGAWNQGEGINGGTFNTTVSGTNAALPGTGGATPFSTNTTTLSQTVNWVNQPPSFERGLDQVVLNTAGSQSVTAWATNISAGPSYGLQTESGPLTFIVSNNDNALFSSQPSISSSGVLTFTPAASANGIAIVTVQLQNGGSATSAAQTFQIAVTPSGATQPPIISIPFATQNVNENGATPTSLTFSSGNGNLITFTDLNSDASTATDSIALTVTGGTVSLSSTSGLTGSGNGTNSLSYSGSVANLQAALAGLVFTPTQYSTSASTIAVAVTAVTTGGSATLSDTVNIAITPVNQPPSFTPGANPNINENAGAQTVTNWATNISPGPGQSGESVSFSVSVGNPSLFSVLPTISPTGTLTYTPANDAFGTTSMTVTMYNSGSTANGGVNSYTPVSASVITIVQVDQPPVISVPNQQRVVENVPLAFSAAEYNAITVSQVGQSTNTLTTTVSIPSGDGRIATVTLDPSGTSPAALIAGNGTGAAGMTGATQITITGQLASINAILNTLVYTPPSNTTGTYTLTISTDDNDGQSGNYTLPGASSATAWSNPSVSGGPITIPNTVTLDVVTPPTLVIDQLNLPTPSAETTNQWIEIQGPANYTIPANTYLIAVSGSTQTFNVGGNVVNTPTGTVYDTFNLGGYTTGSDGMLVILQNLNEYDDNIDSGQGVIDPRATILENTTLSDGAGFGNNYAESGSSSVGHSNIYHYGTDVNALKPGNGASATYMLISPTVANPSGFVAPTPGDSLDEPLNTTPTGALHGAEYSSWNVQDSIGMSEATSGAGTGDETYGYTNFVDDTNGAHGTNFAAAISSTTIPVSFTADFVARTNTDLGDVATDWVASSGSNGSGQNINGVAPPNGGQPFYGIGKSSNTEPSAFAEAPINDIGGPNMEEVPASTLSATEGTAGSALQYDVGQGAVAVDQGVTASNSLANVNSSNPFDNNPNSYFLGSATVTIASTQALSGAPTNSSATVTGLSSTSGLYAGEPVSGAGIPNGTTISAVNSSTSITLSANYSAPSGASLSGAVTSGSASITGLSSTSSLYVGELISGTGIPLGSTISTITSSTAITISANATATGTPTLTFATPAPQSLTGSTTFGGTSVTGLSSTSNLYVGELVTGTNIASGTTITKVTATGITLSAAATATGSGTLTFTPTTTLTFTPPGGGYAPSTDTLAFAGTENITGTFSASTGTLTLTGYDTYANWNAALQAVTFDYTGASVTSPDTRAILFQVTDGETYNAATQTYSPITSSVASDLINLNGTVSNPPIVTGTSSTAVTWTQTVPPASAPVVLVAPNLALSDASTSNLTGAVAQITTNEESGEDVLGYSASLAATDGITVTGTHKLTFSGPATVAQYQALLQTVTYTDTSEDPTALPRTITFTVTDSNGITSAVTTAAQQVVNVVAVNIPPITTNTSGADSYTIGNPAILIDQGTTESDPDNLTLVGATVSITSGFLTGDTLSFNNGIGGVTGSYNATTGVLTLSGTGLSPLDYQLAMQAVTFNTSAGAGTRIVSFQADDGATDPTVDGNISTKTIVVTAASTSPVLTTSTIATTATAGYAAKIDPEIALADSNASPVYSATVSITGSYQSGQDVLALTTQNGISGVYSNGTLTISVTGSPTAVQFEAALASITFTTTNTTVLSRTISFSVTDNGLTSNTATKTISVVAPAAVTGIYVSGSGWNSTYFSYLANNNMGNMADPLLGYALLTGANQLTELPWTNLDTISVVFNETVTISTALQSNLGLINTTTTPLQSATYTTSTFGSSFVATWTFSTPLTADNYLVYLPASGVTDAQHAPLDGNFNTSQSAFAGDGLAGNDLAFQFDLLPGDTTQASNKVTAAAVTDVRSVLGALSSVQGSGYNPFYDDGGVGKISASDVTNTRADVGHLAVAATPSPPAGASVVTEGSNSALSNSAVSNNAVSTGASSTSDDASPSIVTLAGGSEMMLLAAVGGDSASAAASVPQVVAVTTFQNPPLVSSAPQNSTTSTAAATVVQTSSLAAPLSGATKSATSNNSYFAAGESISDLRSDIVTTPESGILLSGIPNSGGGASSAVVAKLASGPLVNEIDFKTPAPPIGSNRNAAGSSQQPKSLGSRLSAVDQAVMDLTTDSWD